MGFPIQRPRRNRRHPALRCLVRETHLLPSDLIYPIFVGSGAKQAILSMPGISRWPIEGVVAQAKQAYQLGVPAVALFPAIEDKLKDRFAKESANPEGLLQRTVHELKSALPDLLVITDVAMDPYSSDGHDGLVEGSQIVNDATLDILCAMALAQAQAGADVVAPSDMMDGRVGKLRLALDQNGFENVGILAYSAKYASAFYGPFRDALGSAPKSGDKKTYQMDYANSREALREVRLDIEEGADMVMIKPALAYLDVIQKIKAISEVPVAAYNVSGEYAMIQAAHEKGWIDGPQVMEEVLTSIKRAGADMILTYFAAQMAERLN
jgi:porphobilinogen synthase